MLININLVYVFVWLLNYKFRPEMHKKRDDNNLLCTLSILKVT